MNEFDKFHPIVSFTYFAFILMFSCIFMHPITLMISLLSGFIYSVMLNGTKAFRFNLLYMLPVVTATALLNPIFNHEGMTIITYLPGGNPLTLEAIGYGIAAALMLWSVICHFSCFNKIMTSDKFVCLFGKIIPSLSLILTMVLRFVPKFKVELQAVSTAQKYVGQDISQGKITDRAKNGVKILSAMISRSLENSVDTADSMKSRGYGLKNRSSYSNYRLERRDILSLAYIVILSAYIIVGAAIHLFSFVYFPQIKSADITTYGISVFTAYLLLFIFPICIEIWEAIKWKKLKSKI